jgi:2-polyprenyl-6-methoxyphenol hydroxylase-like FAD-dependent oxidoreductase
MQQLIVVGADGIRSTVRRLVLGRQYSFTIFRLHCDFRYLFIRIAQHLESPLLDSATVFQTANGNERIYIMPYDKDSVM